MVDDGSLTAAVADRVNGMVVSALARRSLLVLTYHGVRPDEPLPDGINLQGKHLRQSIFAAQISWLEEAGYHFLSGQEFRWIIDRGELPRRPSVLITFDDGYANNHQVAFPVLRAHGAPAVVFVVGEFVDARRPLWVDRLERAIMHAPAQEVTVDLAGQRRRLGLADFAERKSTEALVRRHCKRLPPAARARVIDEVVSNACTSEPDLPTLYQPLSWEQIRELEEAGWAIGSHTATHTILGDLPSDLARNEIETGKRIVEAHLDRRCDLFAYPNGLRGDFTRESRRLLEAAGKLCAFASIEGRVGTTGDPFALRRVAVRDGTPLREFKLRTTGAVGVAKAVRSRLRAVGAN